MRIHFYQTSVQAADIHLVRAVINETLRLFPPVPLNVRESRSLSFTLPLSDPSFPVADDSKTLYMPGNTLCMIFPLLIQRNPVLWGPDADEFDPERWLDKARLARFLANPTMYTPFSAGPRIVSWRAGSGTLADAILLVRRTKLCAE